MNSSISDASPRRALNKYAAKCVLKKYAIAIPTKYGLSVDALVTVGDLLELRVRPSDIEHLDVNQREKVASHVKAIQANLVNWAKTNSPAETLFFPHAMHVSLEHVSSSDMALIESGEGTEALRVLLKYCTSQYAFIVDGQHTISALIVAASLDDRWLQHKIRVTFYVNLSREAETQLFLHLNGKRRAPSADIIDANLAMKYEKEEPIEDEEEEDLQSDGKLTKLQRRAICAWAGLQTAITPDRCFYAPQLADYVKLPFKDPRVKSGISVHGLTTGIDLAIKSTNHDIITIYRTKRDLRDFMVRAATIMTDAGSRYFDAGANDRVVFNSLGHAAMFTIMITGVLAGAKQWQGSELVARVVPVLREFMSTDGRCGAKRFKDMGGMKNKSRVLSDLIAYVDLCKDEFKPYADVVNGVQERNDKLPFFEATVVKENFDS